MQSASGASCAALVVLFLTPAIWLGDEAAHPIVASVDASSAVTSLRYAFDADAATSWCPDAGDADGEIVVRFPRPVRIRSLTLYAGRIDLQRKSLDWYRPTPIEITTGKKSVQVDARENGPNPYVVDGLGADTVDRLALRLRPARNGEQRCLSEIDVQLQDGHWIFGVPPAAAAALPHAIREMTAALRSCKRSLIQPLVHFPLERRELQVGFAGAEMHSASSKAAPYKSAQAIEKDCRSLVFQAKETPPREPELLRTLGPALVRVKGTTGGGIVYWRLAWTGGRWQLTGIDFTDFE